ncbi:MAG: GntR family transcriptional regulator [Lautropia sp.]
MDKLDIDLDRRLPIGPQVYAGLRREIVTLHLRPGELIVDREIAADLGISRTPVREAFLKLTDEGLIAMYPQTGTFVTKITVDKVHEAIFIREALECAALRQLAQMITPAEVASLRSIIAEQSALISRDDVVQFYAADERFHERLFQLVGKPQAWRIALSAKGQLDRIRFMNVASLTRQREVVAEHEAVAAALEKRDGEAAVRRLSDHLGKVTPLIEKHMKNFGEFFTGSGPRTAASGRTGGASGDAASSSLRTAQRRSVTQS